jgi:hypothetical protein
MYPLVNITMGIMELKKMATSKIKNVNTGEMFDSTKRKNPYSPHELIIKNKCPVRLSLENLAILPTI